MATYKMTKNRWGVEIHDHAGIRRRFSGYADKRSTEGLEKTLRRLVSLRASGESLDPETRRAVERLPVRLRSKLSKCDIIPASSLAASKPIKAHVADFKQAILDKGNTLAHASLYEQRCLSIIDGIQTTHISDMTGAAVFRYLAQRRGDGLSMQSSNHYLRAIKALFTWMVRERRLTESPVAHLRMMNVNGDKRHERRALNVEELRWLLDTAHNGESHSQMSGPERAMLYRVAVETGLRREELRSLTRSSFHLDADPPVVTVTASATKNRTEANQPLRADTVEELRAFLVDKMPTASAFNMPSKDHVCRMFRRDLAAARVAWLETAQDAAERDEMEQSDFLAYVDSAGRYGDFHALRHSFISSLARSGVHPKIAQDLARHSDIRLTMNVYSHSAQGDLADAVAGLPDVSATPEAQRAIATGTDNVVGIGENTGGYITGYGTSKTFKSVHRNSEKANMVKANGARGNALKRSANATIVGENGTTPHRTRTCNLRFRRPTLYPIELVALADRFCIHPTHRRHTYPSSEATTTMIFPCLPGKGYSVKGTATRPTARGSGRIRCADSNPVWRFVPKRSAQRPLPVFAIFRTYPDHLSAWFVFQDLLPI